MATEKLNDRLIGIVFDIIRSDEHLNAAYMNLVKKSKAKNPTQAVNSSIGRAVGRIYKLKGAGIMRETLVRTNSRLRNG